MKCVCHGSVRERILTIPPFDTQVSTRSLSLLVYLGGKYVDFLACYIKEAEGCVCVCVLKVKLCGHVCGVRLYKCIAKSNERRGMSESFFFSRRPASSSFIT